MRLAVRALLLALAILLTGPAAAHQISLAVLQFKETQAGRYTVRWVAKPLEGEDSLRPLFPPHCVLNDPILDCGKTGLVGQIGFEGLGSTQSAAMFRILGLDGVTRVATVTPSKPTARLAPSFEDETWEGRAEVAAAYTLIGIQHILLGIDHLLFVLGLMYVVSGTRALVKTVTAFTIAHSVTLALVTFGWVGVPEAYVNALIALSIVFIGVEVVRKRQGGTSLTLRHPWAVAFGFGLLHGFGFANALIELGLPDSSVPLALLAFNIGVEIGQLGFVLGVIMMQMSYRSLAFAWPRWVAQSPAYVIGGVASYWFLGRVAVLVAQ